MWASFWFVFISQASSVIHGKHDTFLATKNNGDLQTLHTFTNRSLVVNVTAHDLSKQKDIFSSFPGTIIKRKVIGIDKRKDSSGMMAENDADIDGDKYAYFVAFHNTKRRLFWYSGILQERACSGLFPIKANSLYWKVGGKSCGFILFENGNCKGRVTFANQAYNIVGAGFRGNVLFRSVYYECR